jgi:hypothetical protein
MGAPTGIGPTARDITDQACDGSAAITLWNMEQIFHLGDCEVGHAPGTNLASCAQTFEPRYDLGKVAVRSWPVQQIKIEMISTEPGKARQVRAMASPVTSSASTLDTTKARSR